MRNLSTTWSHCFIFAWSSQWTPNTRFLFLSAFHIALSHEETLLISAWGIWNSLGVKGVTFYLTSSFPHKICYWCNKMWRGHNQICVSVFLWWGKVAEQICWATGIVKVILTLKKEGPDINIPKDLNNFGLPPILKSISLYCVHFFFSFSHSGFWLFPFF